MFDGLTSPRNAALSVAETAWMEIAGVDGGRFCGGDSESTDLIVEQGAPQSRRIYPFESTPCHKPISLINPHALFFFPPPVLPLKLPSNPGLFTFLLLFFFPLEPFSSFRFRRLSSLFRCLISCPVAT